MSRELWRFPLSHLLRVSPRYLLHCHGREIYKACIDYRGEDHHRQGRLWLGKSLTTHGWTSPRSDEDFIALFSAIPAKKLLSVYAGISAADREEDSIANQHECAMPSLSDSEDEDNSGEDDDEDDDVDLDRDAEPTKRCAFHRAKWHEELVDAPQMEVKQNVGKSAQRRKSAEAILVEDKHKAALRYGASPRRPTPRHATPSHSQRRRYVKAALRSAHLR